MATHYISPQSVSWPNPTQYIQNVINGSGSAGDTYVLQAGVHRMQTITPRNGDTILFADGAILRGSEDISGGWTNEGGGVWSKAVSVSSQIATSNEPRAGYQLRLQWPICGGTGLAYRTSNDLGSNPHCAYYDGSRLHINEDPSQGVELARQTRALVGLGQGVYVGIEGSGHYGIIENYASDDQGTRACVQGGRGLDTRTTTNPGNWLYENLWIRNNNGCNFGPGDGTVMRYCKLTGGGQIGTHTVYADGFTIEYTQIGPDNGIAGWRAGWEGGNTKLAIGNNNTLRSIYAVLSDHPNLDATGILWWDIDNYNTLTECCLMIDETTNGESGNGGLFYEISYYGKIRRNRIIGSSRNASNSGWGQAIQCSDSEGSASNPLEIYENHVYECAGGIGGLVNGRGGRSGTEYLDVHDNIVKLAGESTPYENTGLTYFKVGPMTDNDYWHNAYYIDPSESRWVDESTDNPLPNGSVNFATWQGTGGHDTDGVAIAPGSHPLTDPDPLNGGMSLG